MRYIAPVLFILTSNVSLARNCMFDSECGFSQRCVTGFAESKGVCAEKSGPHGAGERGGCRADYECSFGEECSKSSSGGVCILKNPSSSSSGNPSQDINRALEAFANNTKHLSPEGQRRANKFLLGGLSVTALLLGALLIPRTIDRTEVEYVCEAGQNGSQKCEIKDVPTKEETGDATLSGLLLGTGTVGLVVTFAVD